MVGKEFGDLQDNKYSVLPVCMGNVEVKGNQSMVTRRVLGDVVLEVHGSGGGNCLYIG